MVDVTDQISHEHEKKNFFTRWFMSTNHKDIGILYIFSWFWVITSLSIPTDSFPNIRNKSFLYGIEL